MARVHDTYRALWERLAGLPGVASAGGVTALPLSQMFAWGPITVEGRPTTPDEKFINVDQRSVAGGYFEAMAIPLVRGRFFTDADTPDTPRVVVIDERMAEQLWPGQKRRPLAAGVAGPRLQRDPVFSACLCVLRVSALFSSRDLRYLRDTRYNLLMRVAWVLLVAAAVLATPGTRAQSPPPVVPVETPPPFDEWLAGVRAEAIERGIAPELVARAFADIKPVEQILERDRTQAEFALDLEAYLKRRLTRQTVRLAQQMHTKHRAILRKVEAKYGVASQIVVSIWGLESNFGRFAGVRPTIPALVTLAYDPRRGAMFREEIFSALEIVNRGDIQLERLKGSWAGALGQPQFMPSSYLEYAQDFDGDGLKDIWSSHADVFASIAFYLQKHGWHEGFRWGREVRIPPVIKKAMLAIPGREAGCRARRLMTEPKPLTEWRTMGLRTTGGARLPALPMPASMTVAGSRTFLLYDNYEALLGYNCAHSYALSVGLLADRLK